MATPPDGSDLPYIDRHAVEVAASPERVWAVLEKQRPTVKFSVVESVPNERLHLRGSHPFARYELRFEIEPVGAGARLSAESWAEFPGPHGRVYRALVIGTRGHVVAVRLMLRRMRVAAEGG